MTGARAKCVRGVDAARTGYVDSSRRYLYALESSRVEPYSYRKGSCSCSWCGPFCISARTSTSASAPTPRARAALIVVRVPTYTYTPCWSLNLSRLVVGAAFDISIRCWPSSSQAPATTEMNDSYREAFESDGYFIIRGALNADLLARLNAVFSQEIQRHLSSEERAAGWRGTEYTRDGKYSPLVAAEITNDNHRFRFECVNHDMPNGSRFWSQEFIDLVDLPGLSLSVALTHSCSPPPPPHTHRHHPIYTRWQARTHAPTHTH